MVYNSPAWLSRDSCVMCRNTRRASSEPVSEHTRVDWDPVQFDISKRWVAFAQGMKIEQSYIVHDMAHHVEILRGTSA